MSQDPKDRLRPHIESSLGRVHVGAPVDRQPFITVDDPTDPVPPEENGQPAQESYQEQLQPSMEARQRADEAHRARKENRMETGAKKRIEILTNLGRATIDVDIEGIVFSLRTLKNREWREAIKAVAEFDLATEQAYEMRGQTLARSIYAIDGQRSEVVLGTDDLSVQASFIQDMDESVVSHLYDKYNDLVSTNKAKYNLNTEEGVQEAVEEIKK